MGKQEVSKLTADDWAMAAVQAIAGGGVAAVSVEKLARELGATKGSFYWHFTDRAALIAATLDLWERKGTTEVIDELRDVGDPAKRLELLFDIAFESEEDSAFEAALAANADDPLVGPYLERVTTERLAFLARIFADLGFGPAEARDRGMAAYAAYVGHVQLMQLDAGSMGAARRRQRYLRLLRALLTAPVER